MLRDSLIRDQIVFGTKDGKTREKLLRETDLTLETAVKMCQASEMAGEHVKTFAERAQGAAAASHLCEAVDAVSIRGKHPAKFKNRNKDEGTFSCKRCGNEHKPRQCPAFGKACSKCRGLHHFA